MGFFDLQSKAPLPTIARCGACGLYKTCKSPKLPVIGNGRKHILIVSESPGKEEDAAGELLVGNSSRELESALKSCKISLRNDCWLTNSIICHSKKGSPTDEQIDHCRPNLMRLIKELEPKVIILLGSSAARALLLHTWQGSIDSITRWVGWNIPNRNPNAWIVPTYHPSYLLKAKDPVLYLMFKKHLASAVAHEERPWVDIPDYKKQVECVMSPSDAASIIDKMVERGGLSAFDYEATSLKPDGPLAEIVSASICWRGKRTIAFPWHGEVIDSFRRYLKSDMPKIASNMKFEHRWSKAHLGVRVRNWAWDTMLSAHHLDNRQSITSIKFQAYVRLGWPLYDEHIHKYITSEGGNTKNSIQRLALPSLLLYNGLDSLLEYLVAKKQMKEAGFNLHGD